MSPSGTMYSFVIGLSDVDRSVYQELKLQLAQHPSESREYLVTRLLGFCLEYQDGIAFSKGLHEAEEPAVWAHDLTGQLTLWLEVGAPKAERLHKASKAGARVVVYTHKDVRGVRENFVGNKIHGAEQIRVVSFYPGFIQQLAALVEKRNQLEISVTGGEVYISVAGQSLVSEIFSQPIVTES